MITNDEKIIIRLNRNREKSLKKNNIILYNKIISWNKTYLNDNNWNVVLYNYIFSLKKKPLCLNCNCKNSVSFGRSFVNGYNKYCSHTCKSSDDNVLNKRKKTNLEKYGVESHTQLKEYKDKIKKNNLEKYGVDNVFKLKKIKEKIKKTNLEKYGVEYPIQNDIIKEKIKKTNLEKYSVEYPSKISFFEEKKRKTNLEKYGVENVIDYEIFRKKRDETNLEKYGKKIASKSTLIKNKIIKSVNIKTILKWSKILNIINNDITYNNENLLIKNYCSKHPEGFEINLKQLYSRYEVLKQNNICTKCNPISEQSSIKEIEIKYWLINDLKLKINQNDRLILKSKELDIFIPNHNLAVEFNGLYYHSDLFKPNNYHLDKTEECKLLNIKLLHIFEDEWVYKPEIVKSIIKSKLGLIDNKIYGRKCEIREVAPKESSNFLNKNHIQGNINSKIRIGLYYSDELVSLMTFGKKRIITNSKSNTNEYEMYRFCNKLNTSVIGGASKLFNYFIKTYNPSEVISYADRRYFDGGIYKNLGFKFVGLTKPNYWYIKGLERHYRYKFRKDVLVKEGFDSNKTEKEIMVERGYYRIYDCGNLKFKYEKQ